MKRGSSVAFIVNPHSGGGSTGREWPHIRALAEERLGSFESALTALPGDATRLARQYLLKEVNTIVCVGGDGTLNEVVNGFMGENGPIRPDAVLGFVPNGTGCDFIKSVSIPRGRAESLKTIKKGSSRAIDLGRIRFLDNEGNPSLRYFHNVASFGLGGEVVARANKTNKALGPFASFITATLVSVMLYGKKRVQLRMDDGLERDVTAWNIAAANGRFHGGGMMVAPSADMGDGLLDVTVIGDLSRPEIFYHLPKLYSGRIREVTKVDIFTCRKIEARSDEKVLLDVDGEQPGCLPVVIDVVPHAIRILVESA